MVVTTTDQQGRKVSVMPFPLKTGGMSLWVSIAKPDGKLCTSAFITLTEAQACGLASELMKLVKRNLTPA